MKSNEWKALPHTPSTRIFMLLFGVGAGGK